MKTVIIGMHDEDDGPFLCKIRSQNQDSNLLRRLVCELAQDLLYRMYLVSLSAGV